MLPDAIAVDVELRSIGFVVSLDALYADARIQAADEPFHPSPSRR
jgi:hypothetical protein